MNIQRFEEYHKYGCHFAGKLVVVSYWEEMRADPKWGRFGGQVSLDWMKKAEALVKEKYGDPKRVLLSVPDYVVELA